MDRPSNQSGEERAFGDFVGIEVGETYHGHIEDRVQLLMFNMAVLPINAILYGSVIGHLVGRFETERFGSYDIGHAQFLDDRLILPPTQELVFYNGLSTTHSYVSE